MNILFVIPVTGTGGIEKLVIEWIKLLKNKPNFNCEILALRNGLNPAFNKLEVDIHFIYIDSKRLLKSYNSLIEFFKVHNDYDVVHSNVSFSNGLVVKAASKAGIKKRISHIHLNTRNRCSNILSQLYMNCFCYLGVKLALRNSTGYFACSIESGKFFFGKEFFDKNGKVINNGICIDAFTFNSVYRTVLRKEYNLTGVVFMHIGRFEIEKNHLFLLDVFYEFTKKNINSKMLLFGEGKLKAELQNKINDYNLQDNVIFMGFRNDVNKFFSCADIMIFPSLLEGFPITFVEAQTSGLPIVSSDNITEEVAITNLIEFVSINDSIKKWVQVSERFLLKKIERKGYSEYVSNSGYDISRIANELYVYYANVD